MAYLFLVRPRTHGNQLEIDNFCSDFGFSLTNSCHLSSLRFNARATQRVKASLTR
jgi:hypothetical protein